MVSWHSVGPRHRRHPVREVSTQHAPSLSQVIPDGHEGSSEDEPEPPWWAWEADRLSLERQAVSCK